MSSIELATGGGLPVAAGVPRRVKLLPIGTVAMRDGRGPYHVRDQAHARRIVAATRAWLGTADLMFDYDHQALHAPRPGVGGTAIAAGWVAPDSLRVEADGIYADVQWTEGARAKLNAREYRYVSPTFMAASGTGDIIQLKNAALVNMGAIDLPAVAAGHSNDRQEVPAMLITPAQIEALSVGFIGFFNDAFKGIEAAWPQIAMKTTSSGRSGVYGWLGQMPSMREWIGDKRINSVKSYALTLENRNFEATIDVKKHDIADDNVSMYVPLFSAMGEDAAKHPDNLVFALLPLGFTSTCYDNQNFFDQEHPSFNAQGEETTASNMQAGTDPAWYLLDTSGAIKPIIYQEREEVRVWGITDLNDTHVAKTGIFTYFAEARGAAGYGLWQKAFGSKLPLNAENYEAAKLAMTSLRGDSGKLLGVRPTLLVVPPELETAAKNLFVKAALTGGESNIHAGELPIMVAHQLAN